MKRFLYDAFRAAYELHEAMETGKYRDNREKDENTLRDMTARYSRFAEQWGLPQINVEKSSSLQISEYLERSKILLSA